MSDTTYDPLRDPRALVKSYHYIDLPGEPPDSKLWPGVNNIIKLRKQDLFDLFSIVGVDLVKAGLYAAGTTLAVSTILTGVATFAIAGIAVPMVVIAVGTIIATVTIGYAVDWMFSELDANAKISGFLRKLVEIVKEATPLDYGDSYAASQWAIVPEWATQAQGGTQ